jgi:hypothetical protein
MDKEFLFYRKLLGLNEHFTRFELRAVYRENAEKYHPDRYANAPAHEKQHALDIMKQINEAYAYLQIHNAEVRHEDPSGKKPTPRNGGPLNEIYCKRDKTYEILIPELGLLLKYSLSKDIAGIERAIKARTKHHWNGHQQNWGLNTGLSENVKKLMNKYNVNYSMTTYPKGPFRVIIVNRHRENEWFYAGSTVSEI